MTPEETKLPSVRLRAMEPEDLDLLYTIENDTSLWSVGNTNVPYSRFALHQFLEQQTGDIYCDKQVRLIVENEDGEVVGMADLVNFVPAHQRAEVGIVIKRSHRNQGYATAALRQLEHYARTTLHLHQLYAIVPSANRHSARLFAHCQFCSQGVLADWLYDGTAYADALVMQKVIDASCRTTTQATDQTANLDVDGTADKKN